MRIAFFEGMIASSA